MTASASRSLPAAPPGTLIKGNLGAFTADKLGFLTHCREAYGDFVPLRFGPMRFWLVSDPEAIGEVLGREAGSFRKDFGLRRAKILLGEGLLTSEGAAHSRRSRVAQPSFQRAAVARYADAMTELTVEMAEGWARRPEVDLSAELSALALAIVGRTLFGADLRAIAPEVGEALTEALEMIEQRFFHVIPLPLWVPTPENRRFLRAKKTLDGAVLGMIRARRNTQREREGAGGPAGDEPSDLLGGLLHARDAHGGPALSDQELADEVMTIFLAGHETTANALTFTLWLLAQNPGALSALCAEIDQVLGERLPTAADMPALAYTQQVFQEAMRLYPPAWILGREATEDVPLRDGLVVIRRGEMVGMSPYVVQRDPRWWPDPLAFRPERFAPDAPKAPPYAYFPFGGGKRACIGRSFAMLEGTMVLASLFQRFEVEVRAEGELALLPRMTLRAADGLPARVLRRQPVAALAAG